MSGYSDDWNRHYSRASITVHTDTKEAKVTYPSHSGGKPFRVIVRQKPNPVGFHARLPGDQKR